MEWTKETLKGTCILSKNINHAKKIIEFYKSFGFYFKERSLDENMFYGPISSKQPNDILSCDAWCPYSEKLIKLPSKPRRKFPREMMVSNDKVKWIRKLVYGKIKVKNYPYITDYHNELWRKYSGWEYAKEIK